MNIGNPATVQAKKLPARVALVFLALVLACGMIYFPMFATASPDEKVGVTFVAENATVHFDGQDLSGTSVVDVPVGASVKFTVSPAENATVSAVTASGEAGTTVLSDSGENTYEVEAPIVTAGLTVSVIAVVEEPAPVDDQATIDGSTNDPATDQDATDDQSGLEVPGDTTEVTENADISDAADTTGVVDSAGGTDNTADAGTIVPAVNQTLANDIPVVRGKIADMVLLDEGTQGDTEDEPVDHKVTFTVGDETTELYVADGTLIDAPEPPANPDAADDAAPFQAWYRYNAEANTKQIYDFSIPVKTDLTLIAVFSTDHVVTFKDYDGYDFALWSVKNGETLGSDVPVPAAPLGSKFSHWSLVPGGEAFTEQVTKDIVLYPVTTQSIVVMFVTNGTTVPAQTEEATSYKPIEPKDVVREGYTLTGWYTNPDDPDNSEFTFTAGVADEAVGPGTTYLYAKWAPKKVGYIINYWNEKAGLFGPGVTPEEDPSNYDLVYTRSVSAEDSKKATGSEENYAGSTIEIGDVVLTNRDNYIDGKENVYNLLDYSILQWTDAGDKPLAGDGTTVINVYAQRITYEFKFDLENLTAKVEDTTVRKSVLVTPDGEEHKVEYSILAKLGQNVSDLWPVSCDLASAPSATKVYKFTNWRGYWSNGSRTIDPASIWQLMRSGTGGYKSVGTARPSTSTDLVQYGYAITPGYGVPKACEKRWYYVELTARELADAEAKDPDFKKNAISSRDPQQMSDPSSDPSKIFAHTTNKGAENENTKYYRFEAKSDVLTYQSGWTPSTWPGRSIPGYQAITTTPVKLTTQYQVAVADNILAGLAEKGYDAPYGAISYYMPLVSYNLNLMTYGGEIGDGFEQITNGYSKSVPYKDPIADMINNITPERKGYEFVGWYLNENCSEGQEYNPDEAYSTMPGTSLTLYAKYKGDEIAVEYYDIYGELITSTKYANNTKLQKTDLHETKYAGAAPNVDLPGIGMFKNWYYEVSPGIYSVAYWDMPISFSGTNISYDGISVYRLYANVAAENYKVTFKVANDEGTYVDATGFTNPAMVPSGAHNTLAWQKHKDPEFELSKAGYAFMGWYTGKNGTGKKFTTATPVEGSLSVYAFFKEKLTISGEIDKGGTVSYGSKSGSSVSGDFLSGDSTGALSFVPAAGYKIDAVKVFVNGAEDPEASADESAKIDAQGKSYDFAAMKKDVTKNYKVVVETVELDPVTLSYKTVTFEADGSASENDGGSVTNDKDTLNPETGTAQGATAVVSGIEYRFIGWGTTQDGTKIFQTTEALKPSQDATTGVWEEATYYAIFAKKSVHTVSFDTLGGPNVASQNVVDGEKATRPNPDPKMNYKTFAGWYIDTDHSAPFKFSEPITADVTVYAKWTVNPVSVTFDGNGASKGANPDKMTADAGTVLGDLPTAPERTGHFFEGWNTEKDGSGSEFTEETIVEGNITVYAQWKAAAYVVTFNTNGGSDVESQDVEYLQKAHRPQDPTLADHTFAGWYADAEQTKQFDFNTEITQDTTVWAKWESVVVPVPPTPPVTPANPTNPTAPTNPGGQTTPGGTVAPQGFPTPTNFVEAAAIPVAEVLRDIAVTVIPDAQTPTAQIDDQGTPLAQGEAWCWVHYYIGFFMAVMAAYAIAVVIRRKKFEGDLELMEARVIGKRESVAMKTTPSSAGIAS